MKKFFVLYIFSLLFFTGCVTTGFDDFYRPWHDDGYFPNDAYLKDNQEIKIFKVNNIHEKFRDVASRWYWCIGYSGFNGPAITDDEIYIALEKLCKKEKAVMAIWSEEYTDTRNGSYSIPQTNYHYYTNAYGSVSTFTTTSYNSYSYSIQRYDYSAYLFIPIPYKNRQAYTPGIAVSELSQHDREIYQQNTGALINIVYKNTTAFYANLSHGDIITNINGKRIYTTEDYYDVMQRSEPNDIWNITFIRNGRDRHVELVFKL